MLFNRLSLPAQQRLSSVDALEGMTLFFSFVASRSALCCLRFVGTPYHGCTVHAKNGYSS